VRSTHERCEAYGIQYSQANFTRYIGCIIADMYCGGNDPNRPGLGNVALFHCNNTCCGSAPFRMMFVGGRIANGFSVKATTLRANLDLTRRMFIEFTQILIGKGYIMPPSFQGMSVIPAEFPYGQQVNSRVPRSIRASHSPRLLAAPSGSAPALSEAQQLCVCHTELVQHG
jgi:hypothetical protein